jgi:hypothetical protein
MAAGLIGREYAKAAKKKDEGGQGFGKPGINSFVKLDAIFLVKARLQEAV